MKRICIFDTTLRDGEQSAHAGLTQEEKLRIASQLCKLGVDVIEAGFPASSPGDFKAVKEIAKSFDNVTIAGLARAIPADIERCFEAVKYAKKPRIHTFIPTSDVHMKYKLQKTREEVLQMAVDAVSLARKLIGGGEVEFSAEDATRSEEEFLYEVIAKTIEAGANVINIPDTVGYSTSQEFSLLIQNIIKNVPKVKEIILSVHCHDDLGLAAANSLAVVPYIQQIECTVNGIGERAGNASLEEIAAGIKTRKDFYNAFTNINLQEIGRTSKLVSDLIGIVVQPNKAIVGKNAFAHSSGIHQDGILKKRETYEIMKPEEYGWRGQGIIIGGRSGRSGIGERLKQLGFSLTEEEIAKVSEYSKKLADRKKEIFDEDLIAIVEDEVRIVPETYSLVFLKAVSGTVQAEAFVNLKKNEQVIEARAKGDGPVDAAYIAINKITGLDIDLKDYSLRAVTGEKEAQGEVTVKIASDFGDILGRGLSTDITEASAKAYLNAINKFLYKKENNNHAGK